MKRVYLDIAFDYDFLLYGIVSQERSHRLVWNINRGQDYSFSRADDLVLYDSEGAEQYFDKYDFYDEINHLDLYLLGNKEGNNTLVPELRNIDYFIVVKGALEFFRKRKFTTGFKALESVQLISEIDHMQLRSRQHLIF